MRYLMNQYLARLILISTMLWISSCAQDGKSNALGITSYGDYGLQFVFCESGQRFQFEAEAVSLTASGAYHYRQIYLHPPGDPNAVQCRFDSQGEVRINDGVMSTKFDNRTLTYADKKQVHFRGTLDGEACSFEYHAKVGLIGEGSQAAGCP